MLSRRAGRFALLVLANVAFLIVLLAGAEAIARMARFSQACLSRCEGRFLANPLPFLADKGIGFREYDPVLGYRNVPRFDRRLDPIRYPDWRGSHVTITANGFRSNRDGETSDSKSDGLVLVGGDSFTFGDQVNNSETWPACLERNLSRPVHNAGVSGYGAAQALLKIESAARTTPPYTLTVWSVLVGRDFERDRHSHLNGFPVPTVVGTSLANISHAMPPVAETKGSRFASQSHLTTIESFLVGASAWSWLLKKAVEGSTLHSYAVSALTELHPHAAPTPLVAEWSLQRFAEIRSPKLLVLQYEKEPPVAALAERSELLALSLNLGIPVVDTFDALGSHADRNGLYFPPYGHHTPTGNDLVCMEIIRHTSRFSN